MKKIYKKSVIIVMLIIGLVTTCLQVVHAETGVAPRAGYTVEAAFTFDSAKKTITNYDSSTYGPIVNIPPTIQGVPVEIISENAFASKYLTSVTIPDTVKRIEKQAFYTNPKLASVTIGNAVEYIGVRAFGNAIHTSLVLPETLVEIGEGAFQGFKGTTLVIPDKVVTIGNFAFSSAVITDLTIGQSVKSIGDYAFSRAKITTLDLPDTLETIGDYVFVSQCLTELTLPANLKSIGIKSFAVNSNSPTKIQKLVLNDRLESIAEYCFQYNNIEELILPNSVTNIDRFAFYQNKIKTLTFSSQMPKIDDSVFSKNELTELVIPETVTTLGAYCFEGNKIQKLTIPSSLKGIELGSFYGNQLEEVTIPPNVEVIWDAAFQKNKISKINFSEGLLKIESSAFEENQLTNVNLPNTLQLLESSAFKLNKLPHLVIPKSVITIGTKVMDLQTTKGNYEKNGSNWQFDFNQFSGINIDGVDNVKLDGGAVDYNFVTGIADFYDVEPAGKTLTYTYDVQNDRVTDRGNVVTLTLELASSGYIVTFDGQGGTVSSASKVVKKDEAYGTLPTPIKTNYDFDGWYTEANGGGVRITATTIATITADQILYAKWIPTAFTITYHGINGETNPNPITYTVETSTITLSAPSARDGYIFDGWYSASNSKVTKIDKGTTGNITLTAKWSKALGYEVSLTETKVSILRVHNAQVNTVNDTNSKNLTITMKKNNAVIATDMSQLVWEVENIAGFETSSSVAKVNAQTGAVIGLKSGVAKVTVKLKDGYDANNPMTYDTCIIIVPGDVNKDNALNTRDVLFITRVASKLGTLENMVTHSNKEYLFELADMDGNGVINAIDTLKAKRMASKLDTPSN